MQITFLIEIGFWAKNLEVKHYEDYMSGNKIKDIKYTSLCSLKIYSEIVVRLKAIKYKINIICYLSSLFLGLAIKPSN